VNSRSSSGQIWAAIVAISVILGIIGSLMTIYLFFKPSASGASSTPPPTPNTSQPEVGTTPMVTIAAPTATPTPMSPPPAPGTILYRADWSHGLDGWTGGGEWKVLNGLLINDGTATNGCLRPTIVPPFQPAYPDYAIEARIQVVKGSSDTNCFGLNARSGAMNGQTAGYVGAVACCGLMEIYDSSNFNALGGGRFDPTGNWHTFRFEVKGTDLKLLIDGSVVAEGSDAKYLSFAGQVGLSDDEMYVNISSFVVYAL
jgi:hypothetical protein